MAQLATALFAFTAVLQLVLAPDGLSVVVALLLALSAWVVRWRAGLLRNRPPTRTAGLLASMVVVFLVFNLLFNVGGGTPAERALLGLLWLLLALASLLVAAAAVEPRQK